MRTTVDLDDDVLAALRALRDRRGVGLSQAVNELIRAGLRRDRQRPTPFTQRSQPLGLRIDVTNVAAALDDLDGPTTR